MPVVQSAMVAHVPSESDIGLWHDCLGHISIDCIRQMGTGVVSGVTFKYTNLHMQNCVACAEGKQHKQPRSTKPETRADAILQLVHTDICGPSATASLGGAKYFSPIVDDKSCFTVVMFLKTKNKAIKKFQTYASVVENQTGCSIKAICSDNGGEYNPAKFRAFTGSKGIVHKFTASNTPWQDGVSECKIRAILALAHCIL